MDIMYSLFPSSYDYIESCYGEYHTDENDNYDLAHTTWWYSRGKMNALKKSQEGYLEYCNSEHVSRCIAYGLPAWELGYILSKREWKPEPLHFEIEVKDKYKKTTGKGRRPEGTQGVCYDLGNNKTTYIKANKDNTVEEILVENENGGKKFDGGKLRFDLILPEVLKEVAGVLTDGARDYGDTNWKKVEPERYHGAVMRHWNAYRLGEKKDHKSGYHPLAHAIADMMFLIWFDNNESQAIDYEGDEYGKIIKDIMRTVGFGSTTIPPLEEDTTIVQHYDNESTQSMIERAFKDEIKGDK